MTWASTLPINSVYRYVCMNTIVLYEVYMWDCESRQLNVQEVKCYRSMDGATASRQLNVQEVKCFRSMDGATAK